MTNPAKQLIEAGFVLEVIEGGGLGVTPRARLTPELRSFIRDNKPAIVASQHNAAKRGTTHTQRTPGTHTTPMAEKGVVAVLVRMCELLTVCCDCRHQRQRLRYSFLL